MKKSIQIGELLYPEQLEKRLTETIEWKNLIFENVYKKDQKINLKETLEWTVNYGNKIKHYICDTSELLDTATNDNKKILFEAQLGALRDIFFGIYPFTTSSSVLSSYAYVGGGLFTKKIDSVIGVMKAFSTCVGAGPFVTEMEGEISDKLREIAFEYGASTGRPRRIGHFDAVASRYGATVQGANYISLTKLDSLSQQESLLICTNYKYRDKLINSFPINPVLEDSIPVYTEMEGWNTDITDCRDFNKLPKQAKEYVLKIEELVGYPIKYISVGPERDSIIIRENI